MKMRLLFFVLLAGLCFNVSRAQSIFSNNIDGTNPGLTSPFVSGQTFDPNITVSGISRGPGVAGNMANNRYNASGWTTATSVNSSDYFEFTITPAALSVINLTSFVYTGQVSATPPTPNIAFRSSLDGFTTNIGSPTVGGTTISLSGAAYQNLTSPITFRFYVYGVAAAGTTYSINDFTFNGSVISASTVDFANLKAPGTGTINLGSTFTVTAQVGKSGLTSGTGQADGITGWIGYSTSNTNPAGAGWTWIEADYSGDSGTYDEYVLDLGSQIATAGTYYYASRFQLDAGTYKYGAIKSDMSPGSFWDGTTYINGVLTVNPTPVQEITVKGVIGSNPTIASGDMTPTGTNNTLFAAQPIGTPQTKTFRIQNVGTAALSVSSVSVVGGNTSDFTVAASAPYSIAAGTFVDFTITFNPTATGSRTTTVTIANNDSNENPYTFLIEGTGTCATASNSITPLSGPVGTTVTVTATANNLTGATATFNGIAATVTQISSSVIEVVVPAGATSGTLVTTNASGCQASTAFTVIDNVATTCQGSNLVTDLFISEVTDATYGGLSYIEVYNGTGAAVSLSNYALQFFANANTTAYATVNLVGTLAHGDTYIVATSTSGSECPVTGGDGSLSDLQTAIGGVNFVSGSNNNLGHDNIGLYKSSVKIDSWGVNGNESWASSLNLDGRGVDFRRKTNVTVPKVAYTNADWDVIDWLGTGFGSCSTNDYSNIGTFNFSTGTPPSVTTQPAYSPSCTSSSFTVAGTEGFPGSNPLAYQWFVAAPGATSWTALTNGGVYSGVTTATLNVSNLAGLDGFQYYAQIRENTATCYVASNAVIIDEAITSTWNGSAWSPSAPTINSIVVINGSYNTATWGSIDACSLTVNSPATLTVAPNNYVNIQNNLTVNAGATLLVQDDASLVMINDAGIVINNGTTQIQRTTAPYRKFDYTYWSSPVVAANVGTTFTGWRTDYAFQFATANFMDVITASTGAAPADGFDDDSNAWQNIPTSTTMTPGKGYAIMAPTGVVFSPTAIATVTFTGRVNNGVITMPLAQSLNAATNADDFNLIGNPYPSALSADAFLTQNSVATNQITGTLYFWTHNTPIAPVPGPNQYNFITADYAMYTLSGGTASGTGSAIPTGKIASGTGFFVDAANGATQATFNNSMRDKTFNNSQFFRPASAHSAAPNGDSDRIWLNFTNANGLFSQQLLAYFPNTTLDFDQAYDGMVSKTQNSVSFYSFIGEDNYRIQARPSFDSADVVPLGYTVLAPGTYEIAIAQYEGIFTGEATDVFLEDKVLGVIHNLKNSPYSFETAAGTFDERFFLRYTDTALGNPDLGTTDSSVIVAVSEAQIKVRSIGEQLESVVVYDLLGRQVYSKSGIGVEEFVIDNAVKNRQPLIVKVKLENGTIVNRKIVF